MDIDWSGCYNLLVKLGMPDKEIADMAGLTRVTVNRVRNHPDHAATHCPSFDGGVAVLKTLRKAQKQGDLEKADLERVGLK